jgi:hypothetical protein
MNKSKPLNNEKYTKIKMNIKGTVQRDLRRVKSGINR